MSVLMAFTAQQAARLSNISDRMLRYWEQTGAFNPEYVSKRETGPFRRIYSFRDLVTLRTLAMLRTHHKVSLQELRSVGTYLTRYSNSPWSDLAIRVYGRHLAFRDPGTGSWTTTDGTGQLLMTIRLDDVQRDSERTARVAMQRSFESYGRITRNRYVMGNSWVFAGTRIPIEAVTELAQAGYSAAAILEQYPTLVAKDIRAALAFDPALVA